GSERARGAQVVLPAAAYHCNAGVEHVHVPVRAHGHLEGARPVRGVAGEPVAVEKARVTGADVVERGRQLVPERVVEAREHYASARTAARGTSGTIRIG